jgi:regulator of protease activity HflC (stomatin/prohibitin superfamily)
MDNPLASDVVAAFADHLMEAHPDNTAVQKFVDWVNGGDFKAVGPHIRVSKHHYHGPSVPEVTLNPADARILANTTRYTPEGFDPKSVKQFTKYRGNSYWTETRDKKRTPLMDRLDIAPVSKRKVPTVEVADHLYDVGGPENLVHAVIGARYFHPDRVKEVEDGTRDAKVTYRQSPALSEFIAAVRQVRSSQQEERRQITAAQFQKLGIDVEAIRDAVADAPHTASVATAHSLNHSGDLDKVRAAVALIGLQLSVPGFAILHEGEGDDLLHSFSVTGSAEKLRQQMDQHGIDRRTLLPTENGWTAVVLDPQGRTGHRVETLTKKIGVPLQTSKGTLEVIGGGSDADGDEDSRASYRDIVQSYEQR